MQIRKCPVLTYRVRPELDGIIATLLPFSDMMILYAQDMQGSGRQDRSLNIGFISTRFEGLDGVSLEAEKWASSLPEFGHKVFWFAGKLDRDPPDQHADPRGILRPSAYGSAHPRPIQCVEARPSHLGSPSRAERLPQRQAP